MNERLVFALAAPCQIGYLFWSVDSVYESQQIVIGCAIAHYPVYWLAMFVLAH
jgi:hypothetical protein